VPGEDWGKGAVTLVEIPADKEIYDNIVAYWRPRKPLEKGSQHKFNYRLVWCDEAPVAKNLARVIDTQMGKRIFEDGRLANIDFAPNENLPENLDEIDVHVSSNFGPVSKGMLQRNPSTGGVRLSFTFKPEQRNLMELRAQMMVGGKAASEVWMYRWTNA
jgi:glucans biosynthesis protein